METGSQSSGFTSHCLPHRENLTRLIECGEIVSGDEINPINPYLVKRPTIITKLPPIVKSSEPSTNLTSLDKMATSKSPNNLINYRSFNLNPSSASSSASSSPSLLSTSATFDDIDHWKGYETNCDTVNSFNNPTLKLRLLEKNLQFIKDQHKMVLNCLHNQIEDLNRKNRDLQFKLIVNNLYPDCLEGPSSKLSSVMPSESEKNSLPLEAINRLNNLEIEVGRLRLALGEALKMNASLPTVSVTISGK
uniref:CCDC92/74 N-terminal domain-containing protein n=1 Tax=Tetranychus urticae TaxID=32264 RepID=T1KB81_TETUR